MLNAQVWESSFAAGNFDDNNNFMGGSEVLQLVSHKNKLFASVSYWQDESNIWYGGDDPNIGWSQILSLDSPNEDWSVDLNLDSYYLRPERQSKLFQNVLLGCGAWFFFMMMLG